VSAARAVQGFLPQLQFEQAFVERVIRACIHALHTMQRQIGGSQQGLRTIG